MKRTIKKIKDDFRLRIGYGIGLLLLLVSYLITLYINRQLAKQSGMVDHTYRVINNMEVMLSRVKDAETGARGFVLTKDSAFLLPYIGSRASVDSIYNNVVSITTDNISQQADLARFKENIDNRFMLLENGLSSFVRNKMKRTDSTIAQRPEARRVMDSIRQITNRMQERERALLAARDSKLNATFITLNIVIIISLIVAFLLLVLGFVTHAAESRSKELAQKKVLDYQDKLNSRITDLNKANEELIRMRSLEKFAATGRIARTIAHEVRNPLTNINLAADQLRTESAHSDENAAFLFDMISKNSSRINQLISDLLNATKSADLIFTKMSVNDLLDEALNEAEDRITLTNVEVKKIYSDDMCAVKVDKDKIRIALLNIIINALEAMENKPGSKLTLETRSANTKCKIMIGDNGQGMDNETVIKLFDPYFTNKPKGNGLGLTNAQNIVLNHNGNISVESELGVGTTFTITLDFA